MDSRPSLLSLETELVMRAGHLPSCGEGAEFPWDCTCDYAGFMEQMDRILAALPSEPPSDPTDHEPRMTTYARGWAAGEAYARKSSEPPSDPEGLRRTQYPGMDALEPVNECTCGHPKHAPGECDGPDESGRCGCMWGRSYNETVAARLSNDTAPEPSE